MNDASGNIQDSSGNAQHSTSAYGGLTYSQSSPITSDSSARSILINTGGFVVPKSATVDVGDNFTIEAWFKRVNSAQNDWFVDRGGDGVDGGYRLFLRNDNPDPLILSQATVQSTFVSTPTYGDTNWHYVGTGKNGATIRMVVDGVDISGTTINTTYDNFTDDLFIGDLYQQNGTTNMYLAEVAIYPTLLSVVRMQAHYAAATTVAGPGDNPPFRHSGRGAGW